MFTCEKCNKEDSTVLGTDRLCDNCFNNKHKSIIKHANYSRDCHNGPVLVISNSPGLEIYGASRIEAKTNYNKFDLVISLGRENRDVNTEVVVRSIGLIRLFSNYKKYDTEHIVLDWPDFNIPSLSRDFWVNLSKVLKKKGRDRARNGKIYKVLVHCMGGHGRTGTALGILGVLIGNWESNIVERVREIHCYKAVENGKQIRYIEGITGVKGEEERGSKENYIKKVVSNNTDKGEVTLEIGIKDKKEDKDNSKKNIDDYFKNRNRWRKDYK